MKKLQSYCSFGKYPIHWDVNDGVKISVISTISLFLHELVIILQRNRNVAQSGTRVYLLMEGERPMPGIASSHAVLQATIHHQK